MDVRLELSLAGFLKLVRVVHLFYVVYYRYEVYTNGPSAIKTAEFTIMWPIRSKQRDEFILYIYKAPEIVQGMSLSIFVFFDRIGDISFRYIEDILFIIL